MRVISGKAKGMKLYGGTDSQITRPLTDRAKEALFNILGDRAFDSNFLDLFAGTGAVGVEALSRGAKSVTFVENTASVISFINKNLEKTRLSDCAHVIKSDVFRFIKGYPDKFDIIFAGPPQYKGLYNKTIHALDNNPQLIAPDGLIVLQCDPTEEEPFDLDNLTLLESRNYGNVLLTFVKNNKE